MCVWRTCPPDHVQPKVCAPKVTVKRSTASRLRPGSLRSLITRLTDHRDLRLKAEFENKDNVSWPGLAVTHGSTVGVDKDALIVPMARSSMASRSTSIYVADDHTRGDVPRAVSGPQETAHLSRRVEEGDPATTGGQFPSEAGARPSPDRRRRDGAETRCPEEAFPHRRPIAPALPRPPAHGLWLGRIGAAAACTALRPRLVLY